MEAHCHLSKETEMVRAGRRPQAAGLWPRRHSACLPHVSSYSQCKGVAVSSCAQHTFTMASVYSSNSVPVNLMVFGFRTTGLVWLEQRKVARKPERERPIRKTT